MSISVAYLHNITLVVISIMTTKIDETKKNTPTKFLASNIQQFMLRDTIMMKKDTVWDIVHYKQHRTNSSISQFTHFTGTHHVYSNIISTGRTAMST